MIKSRLDEDLSEGVDTARLIMPHLDEVFLGNSEASRLLIRGFLEPPKEKAVFDVFLEMSFSRCLGVKLFGNEE